MKQINRNDILKEFNSHLQSTTNIDINLINEKTTIRELNIDSLDIVEISMKMEEKFNINIDDNEMSKFDTVKDLIDSVEKEINKR